jgi:GT2 family glycosyltransferase
VARGEVLAFCDSDCLPRPTWLEEGLAALDGADLVAGEVTFFPPAHPTVWALLTADMFLDQQRNVRLSQAVTANLLVSRRLFEDSGGFDDSMPSGGDYEFVQRLVQQGARLVYAPTAVVKHPALQDGQSFLRKVWSTNLWSAARHARDGRPLDIAALLTFVPFVGVALARRSALRPVWRLCKRRLDASSLRPRRRDEARALCILYLLVAYVAGVGRVLGWLEGRRLARRRRAELAKASAAAT